MLKNVPKLLSGDLLKILCDMGHGDELVIADANFPAEACARRRPQNRAFCILRKSKKTYAVIQTGEERQYGELILVKGVATLD